LQYSHAPPVKKHNKHVISNTYASLAFARHIKYELKFPKMVMITKTRLFRPTASGETTLAVVYLGKPVLSLFD
jgi:hypothetical protein